MWNTGSEWELWRVWLIHYAVRCAALYLGVYSTYAKQEMSERQVDGEND